MDLRQGRLVWAYVRGRGGEVKKRPVVVITADSEIKSASDVVVVVASHSASLRTPWPDDYIELPYHPKGQCSTKLRKQTVAICSWLATIPNKVYPDEDLGGFVFPARLTQIISKVAECCAAKPLKGPDQQEPSNGGST